MSNIPGDPVNPTFVEPNPDNPDRAVVLGAGGDFVVTLSKEPGSSQQFLSRQGTWVTFGTTELTSWGNIVGDITDQADLMAMFALYSPTTDFAPVAFTGDYNSLTNLPPLGTVSPINLSGLSSQFLRGDGVWAIPVDVTAEWGNISGNILAQTDLIALLDLKAPLDSPVFSGTPSGPTPPVDNSSTRFATTAWYFGQAYNGNPVMDGVASSGDSTRWARGNHRHPTDTSLAPLDSPTFIGTPTVPTPAFPNNSQLVPNTIWVNQAIAAVGGIPEAPSDGKIYGRMNGAWIAFSPGTRWDNTGAA